MVSILDYRMGNIRSLKNAIESMGVAVRIISQPSEVVSSERLILPGVGSFNKAMNNLTEIHLVDALMEYVRKERPLLGICLGMQILTDTGHEGGVKKGLGLIRGCIQRFPDTCPMIPHVGFNEISIRRQKSSLFSLCQENVDYYFTHSYYLSAENSEDVSSVCFNGLEFVSSVEHGMVFGTQFHPELSQSNGLHLLKNFITRV